MQEKDFNLMKDNCAKNNYNKVINFILVKFIEKLNMTQE